MTELAKDKYAHGIQAVRPTTTQVVSVGAVSAATTNAVAVSTTCVRLVSTTDCFFAIGSTPTATTSSCFLPANVVEYVRVIGNSDKVAVLQSTSSGTLYVSEGS